MQDAGSERTGKATRRPGGGRLLGSVSEALGQLNALISRVLSSVRSAEQRGDVDSTRRRAQRFRTLMTNHATWCECVLFQEFLSRVDNPELVRVSEMFTAHVELDTLAGMALERLAGTRMPPKSSLIRQELREVLELIEHVLEQHFAWEQRAVYARLDAWGKRVLQSRTLLTLHPAEHRSGNVR